VGTVLADAGIRRRRADGDVDRGDDGDGVLALSEATDAGAAAPGNWPAAGHPVRLLAGACTGWTCGEAKEEGDARVVTADLISRARAGDGDAFRELID